MTVRKRTMSLLLLVICLISVSRGVFAADTGNAEQLCSITIQYSHNGQALSNADFSISYVARQNGGAFEKSHSFSGYSFDCDPQDTRSWRVLANTLESYAIRDRVAVNAKKTTGINGSVSFTGLAQGLYLISGNTVTINGYTYTPEPILVNLPYFDHNGSIQYDASLSPKKEIVPPATPGTEPQPLSLSVVKVWNDSGQESYRPSRIVAELLKDGSVYNTIELNAANNWRYTWDGLDPGSTWRVTEESVPNGYTVTIEQENNRCVITNSVIPGTPKTPKTPEDTKLPQTGMLQWPVTILAAAGMLCLLIGIALRKDS